MKNVKTEDGLNATHCVEISTLLAIMPSGICHELFEVSFQHKNKSKVNGLDSCYLPSLWWRKPKFLKE